MIFETRNSIWARARVGVMKKSDCYEHYILSVSVLTLGDSSRRWMKCLARLETKFMRSLYITSLQVCLSTTL